MILVTILNFDKMPKLIALYSIALIVDICLFKIIVTAEIIEINNKQGLVSD